MCGGSVLCYLEINSESQERLNMKLYNKRFVFNGKVEMPENLLDAVENYLEAFGIIAAIKAGVALDSVRPLFSE